MYLPGETGYWERMRRSFQPDPHDVPIGFVDAGSSADIQAAILCSRQRGYRVCPRGGGHSRIGSGSCSGIVVDVGRIDFMSYSLDKSTVEIGAGLTLGPFAYRLYTDAKRVFPIGSCPSVGIVGYTLAGGLSKLSTKLGFGCDNLEEVKMILANGTEIIANRTLNSEILWASRGGGGGRFGIVFGMRLRVYETTEFDQHVVFSSQISGRERIIPFLIWYFQWRDGGNTVSRAKVLWTSSGLTMHVRGACLNSASAAHCRENLEAQGFHKFRFDTDSLREGSTALDLLQFLHSESEASVEKAFLENGKIYSRGREKRGTNAVNGISFRYLGGERYPSETFFNSVFDLIQRLLSETRIYRFTLIVQSMGDAVVGVREDDSALFGFRRSTHWLSFRVYSPNIGESFEGLEKVNRVFSPHSYGSFVNYEDPTLDNYAEAYFGRNQDRLKKLNTILDPDGVFLSKQPFI